MEEGSHKRRACPAAEYAPTEAGATVTRALFLRRALALLFGSSPAAALLAACGQSPRGGGMGDGMMDRRMPDWMMSGGQRGPGMRRQMRVIRGLLRAHADIERDVEEIPAGIRSRTVSDRPEIADLIRTHVRQMKARVEVGDPIRHMDPLFREIFDHHTKIRMEIDDIPGGVRVTETSDDPQVVLLIRQHAHRAVSEFVAEGMQRAMRPTPLPPGYRR